MVGGGAPIANLLALTQASRCCSQMPSQPDRCFPQPGSLTRTYLLHVKVLGVYAQRLPQRPNPQLLIYSIWGIALHDLHFYIGQYVWPHTRYHLISPIGITKTRKLITKYNKNENRVNSTFV